jgi:hypothetical protein
MVQIPVMSQAPWLTLIILATGKDQGLKPVLGKYFARLYLKNNQHKTGLADWLKW